MDKLDLTKQLKQFYNPPKGAMQEVIVPAFNFLMIDGEGDPNTSESFMNAVEIMYGVSFTLKFMIKAELSKDYKVMPLEGLWWADDMASFITGNKKDWKWTVMIHQPEFVTKDHFNAAVKKYSEKKKKDVSGIIRFETYKEGRSIQVLYIGAYKDEGPVIAEMHKYIESLGCTRTSLHHEIYLSDARKTPPEKLRTIIRQPFSIS
ncbi:MAG: GyrI-like domain-containing protein [Ignavibacteriaceae bacterium]|nr:GyrI-like domain-containing protein [Ignavibacteriaceae bacterium]